MIGLIEYLCTPISNQLPSLAEILNLCICKGYQPFLCSSSRCESVTNKLAERRKEEKLIDRSFSDMPDIAEGQNVWCRNHVKSIWEIGTTVDWDGTSNRSYPLVRENRQDSILQPC